MGDFMLGSLGGAAGMLVLIASVFEPVSKKDVKTGCAGISGGKYVLIKYITEKEYNLIKSKKTGGQLK